ncbi:MAG: hypothetical protein ACRDI2_12180 [Chloroflexota bacterium]
MAIRGKGRKIRSHPDAAVRHRPVGPSRSPGTGATLAVPAVAARDIAAAPAALAAALSRAGSASRVGVVSRLQQTHGNGFVQRLLTERVAGVPTAAIPPTAVVDEGKTGEGPIQPQPMPIAGEGGSVAPQRVNEWGEFDGGMVSDVQPKVFSNGGKTGAAAVHWGGGTGGRGNQGVGTITLTAPTYEGRDEIAAHRGRFGRTIARRPAKAWIRSGTGKAKVTRSYVGVLVGANGTYYITRRAARRIDVHEGRHVSSSRGIHNTHVRPLERRVSRRRGQSSGLSTGTTQAQAIAALQTEVDWNNAVSSFSTADTTANTPGGTTDSTDSARANFYFDYGPRAVRGTNYAHYVDTPPGP